MKKSIYKNEVAATYSSDDLTSDPPLAIFFASPKCQEKLLFHFACEIFNFIYLQSK